MTNNASSGIYDQGGIRPITARWTVLAELELKTAAHLGGGPGDRVDMALLKDARSGRPLLPGTSLAGALRSHLADVLGGYNSPEDSRVTRLFGSYRGDDLGGQSPLIVFDSLGWLPEDGAVEVRDGVQIDPTRGVAEDRKKYDFEVLPAGTIFPLRFDVLVPSQDQESELVSLLVTALQGLADGEIAFGARRSRGFGEAQATRWWAVRYDLTSSRGWMEWILSDYELEFPEDDVVSSSPPQACQQVWNNLELRQYEDYRQRTVADIELCIDGSLLIRSAPVKADAPDAVHLHSGNQPILPGTSLAGALRAHALRIARLVRGDEEGESLITSFFGPRLEGTTAKEGFEPQASRLRITESVISQSQKRKQTRIAVDRFTGGVIKGALFDEEALSAGCIRVSLELRNPTEEEEGLLTLLVRDLLSGEIPVGGGSSVGKGILKGKGTIRFTGSRTVKINENLNVSETDKEFLNEKIRAFTGGRRQ